MLLDEFGLQKHDETLAERHEVGTVFEVISDTSYITSVAGGERHHDEFFETETAGYGAADNDT